MNNPLEWTGLTNGQLRELARAFCIAATSAESPEELPSDAWLDVRLRDLGCPENQLAACRARIKTLPLASVADGGAN